VVELLKMMLEFNPFLRPSASHLIQLPVFDECRVRESEIRSKYRVVMKIDKKLPQNYNDDDLKINN
jgi:hypothetical protein